MSLTEKLVLVMVVGIWICVVLLLRSCSKMASSKREYYNTLTKKENRPMDVIEKINITASMMKLIVTLVTIEIDNRLATHILLKTPYDMLRLDKDIEAISTRVFNAIKKDMYTDENLCLESNYILQFITTQVSNKFTETMVTTNMNLYASKAQNNQDE